MSAPCMQILIALMWGGQITITVLYLGRFYLDTNFMSVLVALQVLLLWIKVQYFAR